MQVALAYTVCVNGSAINVLEECWLLLSSSFGVLEACWLLVVHLCLACLERLLQERSGECEVVFEVIFFAYT